MPVVEVVQCSNGSIPFLSQMCPNLSNKLFGHLRQRISQISQPVKCQKFSNLASFKVIQVLLQTNSPPKRELMEASTTEKEAKISSAMVHLGTNRYKEVN